MSSDLPLLIHNASILQPDSSFVLGDVYVQNGTIQAIATELNAADFNESRQTIKEIDATGLTLLPGVIDPQVHFREPGLEYKEDLFTASCACARGGVTSFLEMPNTRPLTTTQAALDDKLNRAAEKCLVKLWLFHWRNGRGLARFARGNPGLWHQNLYGVDARGFINR